MEIYLEYHGTCHLWKVREPCNVYVCLSPLYFMEWLCFGLNCRFWHRIGEWRLSPWVGGTGLCTDTDSASTGEVEASVMLFAKHEDSWMMIYTVTFVLLSLLKPTLLSWEELFLLFKLSCSIPEFTLIWMNNLFAVGCSCCWTRWGTR